MAWASASEVTGEPLEVACDESGSEGEKLVGGTTDVFAHASVCVDGEVAADCILELRSRTRSPAEEYKASVVLRERNRLALEWLLGPAGPFYGKAHVHLTEKAFFVVGGIVDFLLGEFGVGGVAGRQGPRATALTAHLYRHGPEDFGPVRWASLLAAFNDLVRFTSRSAVTASAESFFALTDGLRPAGTGGLSREVTGLLRQAEGDLDARVEQLLESLRVTPRMDPLFPALVHAVEYWAGRGRPVSIVHDEQQALTAERIGHLEATLGPPRPARGAAASSRSGLLAGIRLVDSRSDPRVQVADLLAGAARRIASEALGGRGDGELIALLRPYVDERSTWGDEASWALLAPAQRRLP